MNPIEEKVHLPDPETQFLVHPLDLPGARKEFLTGWWLGIVATPQFYTALLAFFWAVSNNYVTPILVPLVLVVIAGWISSTLTRGDCCDHGRRVGGQSGAVPVHGGGF